MLKKTKNNICKLRGPEEIMCVLMLENAKQNAKEYIDVGIRIEHRIFNLA